MLLLLLLLRSDLAPSRALKTRTRAGVLAITNHDYITYTPNPSAKIDDQRAVY